MNLPRALLLPSVLVLGLLAAPPGAAAAQRQAAPLHPQATVYFEPNLGQAGSDVHFRVVGGVPAEIGPAGVSFGTALDAGQDARVGPLRRRDVEAQVEGVRAPRPAALQMSFPGSFLGDVVTGERLKSFSNYFVGSDSSRWLRHVPHYASVRYRGVQAGVDLEFHRRNGALEYDFIVASGARAEALLVRFSGHQGLSLAADGSLVVATSQGVLRQRAPRAFQRLRGRTADVQVGFVLVDRDTVAFRLGSFDRHQELVIDPTIEWTKAVPFAAGHMAVDDDLNVYLAGGAAQCQNCYWPDARLRKLDPTGELLWDTTVGGAYWDSAIGLALGPDGSLFVTGRTSSPDFPPPSPGAWYAGAPPGTVQRGSFIYKAFLMKLDPNNGGLTHATYFGGASGFGGEQRSLDWGNAVAVDGSGHVYVTGGSTSQDFPVTANAPVSSPGASGWGISVGFLVKLDPSLSTLELGTYLSSSTDVYEDAAGYDVSADPAGNVVAVGYTASDSFLTTPGAFDPTNALFDYTGFATRFDSLGNLVYSTYVGGTFSDEVWAVTTDPLGRACMTGRTWSDDFPVEPPGTNTRHGAEDAFLTCLLPSGELAASVYYGGPNIDTGHDIGVDDLGTLYVMGITYQGPSGPTDQFVAAFTADGRLDWPFELGLPDTWDNVVRAVVPVTGGAVYTFGALGGTVAATRIDICGQGLRSLCTPQRLAITADTTRWRPQRSTENVIVQVGSPVELDTGQPFILSVAGQMPDGSPGTPVELQLVALPSPPPQGYAFGYTVAWNHVDPATQLLLPSGNYSLVVTAQPRSQQSPPPAPLTSLPYDKVSLVEVTSIQLATQSAALPPNPAITGLAIDPPPRRYRPQAGVQVFPEATLPPEVEPNPVIPDTIRVIATLEPRVDEPVSLHFRSVDVADPSGVSPVITSPAGLLQDNRGYQPTAGDPLPTVAREGNIIISASVGPPQEVAGDSNPEVLVPENADMVEVAFRVSRRPGDNYRIAASTSGAWLGGLHSLPLQQAGASLNQTGRILDAAGLAVLGPGDSAGPQVSEMVTVWRTLHIERAALHSAAPATDQAAMDHSSEFTLIAGNALIDVGPGHTMQTAPDHLNPNDWVGAELFASFHAADRYIVTRNLGVIATVLPVTGQQPPLSNGLNIAQTFQLPDKRYWIRDDDVASLDPAFMCWGTSPLGGKGNLNVACVPNTSLTTTLLNEAFIDVVEHQSTSASLIPLTLNTASGTRYLVTAYALPADGGASPAYWTIQVVSGFEGRLDSDAPGTSSVDLDPFPGPTVLGVASLGGIGPLSRTKNRSMIFLEALRDLYTTPGNLSGRLAGDFIQRDTAHEIMHQFRLADEDSGLMCRTGGYNLTTVPAGGALTDAQLSVIRDQLLPVVDPNAPRTGTCP